MQRTTWKTCLDGTLATTLSWISKVPDLTKWGKKYDIFLSSLNNSRQPQPSGKEEVIVHVEDIRQQRVWALISRLQLRHFSLMTISFELLWIKWERITCSWIDFLVRGRPGRDILRIQGSHWGWKGGCRVGECLDGWMVVTSCDNYN